MVFRNGNKVMCMVIMTTFLLSLFSTQVKSQEEIIIKEPTQVSALITVNNNFSIDIEMTFTFKNQNSRVATIDFKIPIDNITRYGFDVYGAGETSQKDDFEHIFIINGTIPPYDMSGHTINFHIDKSLNNPPNGIYDFDWTIITPNKNITTVTTEIRLPLKKDVFLFYFHKSLREPLQKISPSPSERFTTDNQVVYIWENTLDNQIIIQYDYIFDFLKNFGVIFLFFVGWVVGEIRQSLTIKIKDKFRKMVDKRKYRYKRRNGRK